jgi:hypothetical protein
LETKLRTFTNEELLNAADDEDNDKDEDVDISSMKQDPYLR